MAQALNQLEKIIRPVHLVNLTGLAVAHHQRGAVHGPRHLAGLAHQLFALVLGSEIRVFGVLRLVKHVFTKHALIQARRRNGRHVVKVPRLPLLGHGQGVARTLNIGSHLAVFIGL